jgi:hypothetical protein
LSKAAVALGLFRIWHEWQWGLWRFINSWQAAENREPEFDFWMGKGVILIRGTIKNDAAWPCWRWWYKGCRGKSVKEQATEHPVKSTHDPVTFSKILILHDHGQPRDRSWGADISNLHCHPMASSTRTSMPDELEAKAATFVWWALWGVGNREWMTRVPGNNAQRRGVWHHRIDDKAGLGCTAVARLFCNHAKWIK